MGARVERLPFVCAAGREADGREKSRVWPSDYFQGARECNCVEKSTCSRENIPALCDALPFCVRAIVQRAGPSRRRRVHLTH